MLQNELDLKIEELKLLRDNKKQIQDDLKIIESEIKEEFDARGTDVFSNYDLGVNLKYATVNKVSIDEDVLISIITKLAQSGIAEVEQCIELKPVINEYKVHELIYKGILSTDDIKPALIDKSYKTLKFTQIKK